MTRAGATRLGDGLAYSAAAYGAALVAVALTGPGCTSLRHLDAGLEHVRAIVEANDCHDGAPARILVDPHCRQGICGVTCAPDRWTVVR